jgi:hypothetical protein
MKLDMLRMTMIMTLISKAALFVTDALLFIKYSYYEKMNMKSFVKTYKVL